MKKYFLLILIILGAGCSNDDNIGFVFADCVEGEILGKWYLIKTKYPMPPKTLNYLGKNIIYHFKADGVLTVSGGKNVGYPNGEYEYFFGEDYLGGVGDPKVLLVKIDESKYTYGCRDGMIVIGKSYVDGADSYFKKTVKTP